MADLAPYSYPPLPSDHIRLLKITRADAQIVCSLVPFPLSKHPDFHAISYCWGSESPTSDIVCDKASLKVTPHLKNGLRCIFASVGSAWVWIDAICINQADNVEKASQVARMWSIYSTATRVLIWLGPSEDDIDKAIDMVPDMCQKFPNIPDGSVNAARNLQSFGLPRIKDPVWLALQQIYLRPWFQRLWVVQEAILAQDLSVMCGTKQMQWAQLRTLSEAMLKYGITMHWKPEVVKECRKAMEIVGNMNNSRVFRERGYIPAALLLHISRTQATKEPIDRVYGILGILKPETRQSIRVDYSAESRAQYWRAFVQLFRSLLIEEGPKMLIVLSSATKNPEIPSWCPDLNNAGGTTSIPYVGHSAGGGAGYRELDIERITAPPDSDEVRIPGVKADIVIETAELTNEGDWDGMPQGIPRHFRSLAAADARCLEVLEKMRPRFNISKLQYARTLVANQDWRRKCEFPEDQLEEDYEAAFKDIRAIAADGQPKKPSGTGPARRPGYLSSLPTVLDGRSFFVTEKGRIGVGPRAMKPGDHVCVIFAGYCPFILRSMPGTSTYRIVGDAYVDGLMKGEIFELFDIEKNGYETFRIV